MYLAQQWEKSIDILSGYADDRSGAFSKKKKNRKILYVGCLDTVNILVR